MAKDAKVGSDSLSSSPSSEPVRVKVTGDMSDKEIVDLDNEGAVLLFDVDTLRELSEGTTRKLGHDNARDYFLALGEKRARRRADEVPAPTGRVEYVRSPFEGAGFKRMEVVKKPGWHDYWADPREVDNRKAVGYVVVEDHAAAPNADHSNSTNRLFTDDGKVDLVHMRVPDEKYKQHIQSMSDQSRARIADPGNDQLKETIELANRKRKGRKGGIQVINESHRERE